MERIDEQAAAREFEALLISGYYPLEVPTDEAYTEGQEKIDRNYIKSFSRYISL